MNRIFSFFVCTPRSACYRGEFCEHHFAKALKHETLMHSGTSYASLSQVTREENSQTTKEEDAVDFVSDVLAVLEVAEAVSEIGGGDNSSDPSSSDTDYSGDGGNFGGGGASGDW